MTPVDHGSGRVRVFLVDDHEIVRDGLRVLIDPHDDLEVAGEAASCAEARELIPLIDPDIAVVDVGLPDGSGLDLCRELTASSPGLRSLLLTPHGNDITNLEAIDAGASAIVAKSIRCRDLLEAIRHVACGRSLLDGSRASARTEARTDSALDPRIAALSTRQRRVLDLVALGFTNRQIAVELGLTEKTVKNTVSTILFKLGVTRRVEAAVIATKSNGHVRS